MFNLCRVSKKFVKQELNFFKNENINVKEFDKKLLTKEIKENKDNIIILDAIIGISSRGNLKPELSLKIKFLNSLCKKNDKVTIFSLDIPTGFDPESGLKDKNTFISDEIIILGSQLKKAY